MNSLTLGLFFSAVDAHKYALLKYTQNTMETHIHKYTACMKRKYFAFIIAVYHSRGIRYLFCC